MTPEVLDIEVVNSIKNQIESLMKSDSTIPEELEESNTVRQICSNNVIPKKKLRKIQSSTLNQLSEFLSATYGPMSSTTQIISGNNKDTIAANYSKDGLKVLKHITFDQPLEMAIQSEIEDVARFVEKRVGDGTTSSVILSAEIFDQISKIEMSNEGVPPRKIINTFKECIEEMKSTIESRGRDITLEDIYNICMISTNGNEEVSTQIANVYKQYGFDVSIDVGVSNDHNTKVKIYDGLTINEGYSDPAYINNNIGGTADIHNARIYAFRDNIDTPEMISFMEKILLNNIYEPASSQTDMIPTVIISPHISKDASGLLTKLVTLLYSFNKDNMQNQKPPVLLITNLTGADVSIFEDIAHLCKCKMIQKYIDPKIQEAEQAKGNAPTVDTVIDWYGECQLVSADANKTKFINPKSMLDNDDTYNTLVNFLKAEIAKSTAENDDVATIGILKKRLRCLEANMIEYLVGGISMTDRDALKDLVEDAVKNCSSAAEYGVGFAANFEGLNAASQLCADIENTGVTDSLKYAIAKGIFRAYYKAATILYSSAIDSARVPEIISASLVLGRPFNVINLLDHDLKDITDIQGANVLCSIKTDIEILDGIFRIVSLMATANQSLVQVPALNRY